MAWRSTQRVVSTLFLLLVVLDLTVPGFCKTDSIPLGSDVEAVVHTAAPDIPPGIPNDGDSERPDDCFCCCVHIKAEPHFDFPQTLADVESVEPARPPGTHSDPRILFHPPRELWQTR